MGGTWVFVDELDTLVAAAEWLLDQKPATDEGIDRGNEYADIGGGPGRYHYRSGYRAAERARDPFAEAGESKEE
jgi:hypothetical protein